MTHPAEGSVSRRDWLMGAVSLWAASTAFSQQDSTFSADVKVVSVLAAVRNGKGEIVRGLTKDDFAIDEEGQPQTIRYFSRETDLPLTLGLLVDVSGSQRRVLGEERRASYAFLEQVLREDKDQGFVIQFEREVELVKDLTHSRKELESAVNSLDAPELHRQGGLGGGGGHNLRLSPQLVHLLSWDLLVARRCRAQAHLPREREIEPSGPVPGRESVPSIRNRT